MDFQEFKKSKQTLTLKNTFLLYTGCLDVRNFVPKINTFSLFFVIFSNESPCILLQAEFKYELIILLQVYWNSRPLLSYFPKTTKSSINQFELKLYRICVQLKPVFWSFNISSQKYHSSRVECTMKSYQLVFINYPTVE